MSMFDNFKDQFNRAKDANPFSDDTKRDDTQISPLGDPESATDNKSLQNNRSVFENAIGSTPEDILWSIEGENWYKYFGYLFTIEMVNENEKMNYMLPIPPSSYICKPIIPAQVTPSLGGIIEEVSDIKFFLISMEGTTGMAGGRSSDDKYREQLQKNFRDTITTTGLLSGTFAQATGVLNKVAGAADRVLDTVNNFSLENAAHNIKGAINDALTPPHPYGSSAIHNRHNGFTEAYTMKKFFYVYHILKNYSPKNYNLYFTNIKTDQSWRIIVKDFNMQQNAQNPFLIRYSMSLQAWDVNKANRTEKANEKRKAFDRFGIEGDLKEVNSVNVASVSSKIKKSIKSPFRKG